MDDFEPEVIEKLGVKLVIGKGGMGPKTTEAMRKFKAAYAIFTGGAGVLAAKAIKRVLGVHWLDLGIAEAMWILEVENFGPLTVVIDSYGNNYYEDLRKNVREKVKELSEEVNRVIKDVLHKPIENMHLRGCRFQNQL
jgi:fumarase beta subunit (EC 4.2.1.2)